MNLRLTASAGLLLLGSLLLQPHGQVQHVPTLRAFWAAAAVMGLGFLLSRRLERVPPAAFWGVAIACRLLLLPMEPGDDIWRYLWEGKIQTEGFSPYHLAPDAAELAALRPAWWPQINFPSVTALYPPLTELLFRLLAELGPGVLLFKSSFLLADLGVCRLLTARFGRERSLLYGWNPMVIVSFAGGGHFDSWFLLPLVAGWLLEERERPLRGGRLLSALLIGISLAIKWVSLPLLVFLAGQELRAGPLRRSLPRALAVAAAGGLPLLLSSLFFCSPAACPLVPTSSNFVSQGRSAEFLPHLVGQLWPASLQSNAPYGLLLAAVVAVLLLCGGTLGTFALRTFSALLLLSPIVHFWYFTWLVPFAVPRGNGGVRLVSLSGFVYFVLLSRRPDWWLSDGERALLWLPFLLGWLWTGWTCWRERSAATAGIRPGSRRSSSRCRRCSRSSGSAPRSDPRSGPAAADRGDGAAPRSRAPDPEPPDPAAG